MIRRIEWQGNRRVIVEEPLPPVSRFQAREALRAFGLFEQAEAVVQQVGGVALRAWEEAGQWEPDSEVVRGLSGALGLTDEQRYELFDFARSIKV